MACRMWTLMQFWYCRSAIGAYPQSWSVFFADGAFGASACDMMMVWTFPIVRPVLTAIGAFAGVFPSDGGPRLGEVLV